MGIFREINIYVPPQRSSEEFSVHKPSLNIHKPNQKKMSGEVMSGSGVHVNVMVLFVALPLLLLFCGAGALVASLLVDFPAFRLLFEAEKSESLESSSGSHCMSESELLRDSSSL